MALDSVVSELKSVNTKTDRLIDITKDNADNSAVTEGVGTIIKDDIKSGLGDVVGTITSPLKAFSDAIPGMGTLSKVTGQIGKNAILRFKNSIAESKLDKREHSENINVEKSSGDKLDGINETQVEQKDLFADIAENTRQMKEALVAQGKEDTMSAAEVETANEQRRQTEQLINAVEGIGGDDGGDGKEGKKTFGGFLGSILGMKAAITTIVTVITATVIPAITAFAVALAPFALPIIGVVAAITAAIGFITGFIEGFKLDGIFGGLKEGMMKLFDWFIGLPLNLLKDVTVWALNALGMENLASALDAFPLVESLRGIFGFVMDLIITPIGLVIDTVTGIFGGLFDIIMAPIKAFGTAIMAVFEQIDNIFGGIMMIFSGDISGGFQAIWDGIKNLIMVPINFVKDTITGIFGGLFDIFMAPFRALQNAFEYLFFGETSTVGKVVSWLSETFGGLFDMITLPFRKVYEFVTNIFSDPLAALQALWDGLTGGISSLWGLITMPIDAAINWIMGLFSFGDPEKPFSLLGLIKDTVASIWDWFTGLFTLDFGGLMDGLFSIGRIMKGLAKGGWAAVKAMLPGGESPGEAFSRVYNEVTSGGEGTMPDEQMESSEGDMSDPAPTMSADQAAAVQAQMDEIRDRITRSNAGENVYTGPDAIGRGIDAMKLQAMEREFAKYRVESSEPEQVGNETQQVSAEVQSIDDQLAQLRAEKEKLKQQAEEISPNRRLDLRRNKDAQRRLASQEEKLLQKRDKQVAQDAKLPTGLQYGYTSTTAHKVYFRYTSDGNVQIEPDQAKAELEYRGIGMGEPSNQGGALEQSTTTANDIARDYQTPSTNVVNAPSTNVTNITNGGGGSYAMPINMQDNSSAASFARNSG